MTNKMIHEQERAKCPMCKQDMVYAAFVANGIPVWTWLCNCRVQPPHILADIENARLEPGVSLVYHLEIVNA